MIIIDRVYQKVLALANKEQRGYITPQEFNLFADIAQMDIFEQYFHDLEKTTRKMPSRMNHSDKTQNLDHKISIFQRYDVVVTATGIYGDISLNDLSIYRLGRVSANYENNEFSHPNHPVFSADLQSVEVEPIDINNMNRYATPLTKAAGISGPRYIEYQSSFDSHRIKVYPYPTSSDEITVSYIEKPITPNWTYFIGSTGAALYNPDANDHVNFQLHNSEENNLVIKILQLAGISIKDYQLAGAAAQQEAKKIQQENQ
jgi:hypothetical protein|tara:strand:+ start:821 stop:1597 length:777 start_codon:yes stop_codon:yes gene_type:complete